MFVWAVTDRFNLPVGSNMGPFIVGMVVMAIGISFGANAGYAINPARDFGPRMFALVAGWKKIAFPGDYGNVNTYFWIPIVGPLVGAALAVPIYDWGIRSLLIARLKGGEPPDHGVVPDTELVEEPGVHERGRVEPERAGPPPPENPET